MRERLLEPVRRELARRDLCWEKQMLLTGTGLAYAVKKAGRLETLRDAEFSVFSQWGEDGIIQYLLSRVAIERRIFVEFGVEDYRESNTRFLLLKDNWRGLVIDGGSENVASIRRSHWSWKHRLDAVAAFITRENINAILRDAGIVGDIGLLSVDIDGNDYWVLEAIEVVHPRILICEYNALWGRRSALSVPYDPQFVRSTKHFSNLYWGASLPAFAQLAAGRGYALVGTNSAGTNAFFVRRDVLGDLPEIEAERAWVERHLRESRSETGELDLVGFERQLEIVGHLPLVDVVTGRTAPAAEAVE